MRKKWIAEFTQTLNSKFGGIITQKLNSKKREKEATNSKNNEKLTMYKNNC